MAQSFALAFIAFMDHPSVVAIYAVAMLGGVATAFDNPARRAYVVEMVPEANVQNAVSLNSALMTGARVVGPALAGLLITTVGYGWTFAADGVSYLAVILGLFMMRTQREPPPSGDASRQGSGARRHALRAQHARTVRAVGDDGHHRHLRVQLPDGHAAADQAHPARHRPDLHPDLQLHRRRIARRRSAVGAANVGHGSPDHLVGVRVRCSPCCSSPSRPTCRSRIRSA